MFWVALVVVGVPLWLALGAIPIALWNRRQVRRTPGAFTCKVRAVGPLLAAPRPRLASPARPLLGGFVPLPPGAPRRARLSAGRLLAPARRHGGRPPWGRFPHLPSTAWWVRDVLAVQGGLGLGRTKLFPVAAADVVRPMERGGVRGLGEAPRSVLLILGDGQLVEVAVSGDDTPSLAGPRVAQVPAQRN